MTETIFDFLAKVGFHHPIHAPFTHVPMGMVIGAVTFRFASFLPRLKMLAKSGYYCVVLGLLGLFPTIFTGYLDWQHRYGGEWEALIIIKMVLAGLLGILMVVVLIMDDPETPRLDKRTGFYFLMMLMAVGLGYCGGDLVFG